METPVAKTLIRLTQTLDDKPNNGETKLVPATTIPVFMPMPITLIIKNWLNSLPVDPPFALKVQNLFQR